jgi:Fe-S cluster assembly protein SufD
VNGRFAPELSSPVEGENYSIRPLSQALADPRRAAALEPHLGRCAPAAEHAFAAWNTAFFTDGACIEVPRGTVLERPVHAVFVAGGMSRPESPWACYPRNLIVAGEASQLAFIETFVGTSGPYLTNAVTEIIAGPAAVIDYYKVEDESATGFHVAAAAAQLERDSSLTSHSLSFGGALVRNDLNVTLGDGSHCTLNGLFAVDGRRLVDNHTLIDHREPHATSRELYKGLLRGESEGVFNGAIIVRDKAQKSDAVQHSRNLLLSELAQINTKPQLEIRASDVRCFHGATIGQLDEDAAFYLKSRGVGEAEARRILVRGFAAEIMNTVRFPLLRDRLERRLGEWLEAGSEAS